MATPCRGDCEAGGMIQLVFYCRVREHRLAVPTRDREHRLGAEARRQSLSRRSPTAPFAQGSRLCLSASSLPSAAAQYDSGGSPPLLYYLRFRGELQETLENFLQSFLKVFQIFLKKVLTF